MKETKTHSHVLLLCTLLILILIIYYYFIYTKTHIELRPNLLLNNGSRLFTEGEEFYPNTEVRKQLTVLNNGTVPTKYSLYLENVKGELGQYINFSIYQEEILMYSNNALLFNRENPFVPNEINAGETVFFTILVEIGDCDNNWELNSFSFDIVVDIIE